MPLLIFTINCTCVSFQSNIRLRVPIDIKRWLLFFARFETGKKHFIEDWFCFRSTCMRGVIVRIWNFLDSIFYLFICVTSWILARLIIVINDFRKVLEKTLVLFLHIFLIFLQSTSYKKRVWALMSQLFMWNLLKYFRWRQQRLIVWIVKYRIVSTLLLGLGGYHWRIFEFHTLYMFYKTVCVLNLRHILNFRFIRWSLKQSVFLSMLLISGSVNNKESILIVIILFLIFHFWTSENAVIWS